MLMNNNLFLNKTYIKKSSPILILTILSLIIFYIVNKSPVDATGLDPRVSLVVSQSLIENQTIKLDEYVKKIPQKYYFQIASLES